MTVHLVGAGPGDPGLITVRGAQVLAAAHVVVHDRLVGRDLLDLAPATAQRIDVGKAPDGAGPSQEEINRLLVELGRTGATVVRLKGGDPFVLGRGGEEAAALAEAGVRFEVVPGVSSAIAAPAAAGIPVTHRGLAAAVTIVSGHAAASNGDDPGPGIDWSALAATGGTLVVLMGAGSRSGIAAGLMAGGLDPRTPVAAVRWGTRPYQQVTRGTLANLSSIDLSPPVVFVIGPVASLALVPPVDSASEQTLAGRRVVVTRARAQTRGLAERLEAAGAEVVEVPTIAIEDPADGGRALQGAVGAAAAGRYDWIAFTSTNAAARFLTTLGRLNLPARVRLAAVGPGTAAALAAGGLRADLVAARSTAEGLAEAFPEGDGSVLLPQAAEGREALVTGLRAKGWAVDRVEAYRTVAVSVDAPTARQAASADAIAFTSASTVTGFLDAAGATALPPVVVCIGPVTAAAAEARGVAVDEVADEHNLDGLVAALARALGRPA